MYIYEQQPKVSLFVVGDLMHEHVTHKFLISVLERKSFCRLSCLFITPEKV